MERKPFDLENYLADIGSRPCFICATVSGDPNYFHHTVWEDEQNIIFLSKYPTLPGYCLVCPKDHKEDLAYGLSSDQYLRLQANIHTLSKALKTVFDAERIYVLSLGSQQANSHVHFHVVPLPAGVPLEHQQYHALMAENGVLQISDFEMAEIAAQIASAYETALAAS